MRLLIIYFPIPRYYLVIYNPAIIFDNKFIIFDLLALVAIFFVKYDPLYIVDYFSRPQIKEN